LTVAMRINGVGVSYGLLLDFRSREKSER
jgi:hypothetical protein